MSKLPLKLGRKLHQKQQGDPVRSQFWSIIQTKTQMFLYDSASEKHENSTNPRWIFFYNQAEREMMSKKCR